MVDYVRIVDEDGSDPIELPTEEDKTLLLTTVAAQFPAASGLKYSCQETMRGIRLVDGRLCPPPEGWSSNTYIVVYPKDKRKTIESSLIKAKRLDRLKCTDLIVLGIPWKSTEDDVKKYFSQFGDVVMVQLKYDYATKQSKGYCFIRFSDYEAQVRVLSQRHTIDGRVCNVRIPNSKVDGCQTEISPKIYVGRTTEDMTVEDFREYFSQYGNVQDVFIPKPFRGFAFVTFSDPWVAHGLHGDDHIIKNVTVHIASATPKGSNDHNFDKQWFMKVVQGEGVTNQYSPNNVQMSAAIAAAQAAFTQNLFGMMSLGPNQNNPNTNQYNSKSGQSAGGYQGLANSTKDINPNVINYGGFGGSNSGVANGNHHPNWNRDPGWHSRSN